MQSFDKIDLKEQKTAKISSKILKQNLRKINRVDYQPARWPTKMSQTQKFDKHITHNTSSHTNFNCKTSLTVMETMCRQHTTSHLQSSMFIVINALPIEQRQLHIQWMQLFCNTTTHIVIMHSYLKAKPQYLIYSTRDNRHKKWETESKWWQKNWT